MLAKKSRAICCLGISRKTRGDGGALRYREVRMEAKSGPLILLTSAPFWGGFSCVRRAPGRLLAASCQKARMCADCRAKTAACARPFARTPACARTALPEPPHVRGMMPYRLLTSRVSRNRHRLSMQYAAISRAGFLCVLFPLHEVFPAASRTKASILSRAIR